MGAIGLLAETLAAEKDPSVAQRLASRIHTEAFRISRIIDDLLDLSRIEAEEAPPAQPVLVNLIMAEAVERMPRRRRPTRCEDRARGALTPCHGPWGSTPARVCAVQPPRERREILLRRKCGALRRSSRRWTSAPRCRRSGCGHPARDLDRIFERFYRVDQGRSRNSGGTGLGLSIVRHVAANHQGHVEVDPREGEGSTFRLILPTHSEVV